MIRFLYNLLFPIALLVFLPSYIGKMLRRGNYSHKFGQRLGFYDRGVRQSLSSHRWTWIHAVSVGEVMIALKLATKLKEREPDLRVALTTTTTTGFALASKHRAVRPPGQARDDWEILRDLIQAYSGRNGIYSIEDVFREMSAAVPALAGLSLSKIGDLGVQVIHAEKREEEAAK